MIPVSRRIVISAVLALCAAGAYAQSGDFPTRQITIVVPFPPGGVSDQLARGVGAKLAENLRVGVIVENRPGGVAQIAATAVKQAPADGYTILIGDIGAFALNPSLYPKLTYSPLKDFTPLARLVLAPAFLLAAPNSSITTAADLVTAVKTRPGGVSIASQSAGSGGHLFAEMLRAQTRGNLNHVPYRGSAPALNDLLGGQVEVFFDPIITSGPFVKEGKLKALAIGAEQRSPQFPQVPTLREVGLGDINLVAWFGMAVKAGTPAPIVSRLSEEVVKAIRSPDVAKRFTDQSLEVAPQTATEFRSFVEAETRRWDKVIKDSNITVE